MNDTNSRKNITENWLDSVDYLIRIGKLNSYRDLEAKTGISNQRVTLIKAYIRDPENNRNAFAHVDYLYEVATKFNVSLDFLFYKKGPIITGEKINESMAAEPHFPEGYSKVDRMEKELNELKEKIEKIISDH